jgi:hypothetical protein
MDTAVLHGLDRIRDLDQLSGGGFRVGVGSGQGELHFRPLIDRPSRRARLRI